MLLALVSFGRSAAQILQNGPRQLGLLGCAPCSPSGGPFWPRSSPNPPKRTSPASSGWRCSLLSLWWSVLTAQQPESFKTDRATLLCWAVLLALLLVVRFGRSAAQIRQNGPRLLGLLGWPPLLVRVGRSAARILQNGPRHIAMLGCAPCSPSGGPFWPLSSPNPSKRTSPGWPPLLVRFGRSAAQIFQNGPRQLGLLGCAPCSPSGGPFWPLSSPNPPKRTSPA